MVRRGALPGLNFAGAYAACCEELFRRASALRAAILRNRAFSASSSFMRAISDTSMPPYFDRHL